jgi:hypothetical protein
VEFELTASSYYCCRCVCRDLLLAGVFSFQPAVTTASAEVPCPFLKPAVTVTFC